MSAASQVPGACGSRACARPEPRERRGTLCARRGPRPQRSAGQEAARARDPRRPRGALRGGPGGRAAATAAATAAAAQSAPCLTRGTLAPAAGTTQEG